MDFRFVRVDCAALQTTLERHVSALPSAIDAFLEDHILTANHYHILLNDKVIGWTSIHQEALITQFGLFSPYKHQGQRVFARVRKLENVQAAFVPTCDEFFLSHALDDFRQIEKQACFFQYDPQAERYHAPFLLAHRRAGAHDIPTIQALSGTFFDKLEQRIQRGQLYLTQRESECVGFGIIEQSVLRKGAASVGMYTVEPFRGMGIGPAIITFLRDTCMQQGLQAVAGCWYYNHRSKKTLERAGMYSKTRLLRVLY